EQLPVHLRQVVRVVAVQGAVAVAVVEVVGRAAHRGDPDHAQLAADPVLVHAVAVLQHAAGHLRAADVHRRVGTARGGAAGEQEAGGQGGGNRDRLAHGGSPRCGGHYAAAGVQAAAGSGDRKSTRLNSSHVKISYAVF